MEKVDSEVLERNKMKKYLIIIFTLLCCFSFIGCGNNSNDLNTERSRLILRLFDSLEKEDYESAKIQALKLQKDNPTFFCMNDSEYAGDSDRNMSKDYLDKRFPQKSAFEK